MIALVYNKNSKIFGKFFCYGLPIVKRSEQAVEDDKWISVSKFFMVKF